MADVSKLNGYAVQGQSDTDANVAKLVGYAVAGQSDSAANVAKLVGYSVLGASESAVNIAKVVGYAIFEDAPVPPSSTIAFVTYAAGSSTAASNSQATAAFSLTTGQHVFVWVVWEGGDATVTVTDTAGNTYTALTHTWTGSTGGQWFYKLNATGNASNVVTASRSANGTYQTVEALVLSGAVASVAVQTTVDNSSTSEVAQAATVTDNPGAMLLAGYKGFGGDSSKTFFKGSTPMTSLASGSIYSEAAYLARPAGDAATVGPKYTNANVSNPKILHVVTVDVAASAASSSRPQVCTIT